MDFLERIDPSFYALLLLCVGVFVLARRMHGGDWLNPMSAFVFLTIGVFTGISYLSVIAFSDQDAAAQPFFGATLQMSFIYLLTTCFGYSWTGNPVRRLASRFLRRIIPSRQPSRVRRPFVAALLAGAALSFALLMVSSGVGTLWLTDTREAYQLYRRGVGHWWLMYQWFVMAAFFAMLALRRDVPPTHGRLLATTVVFAALLYFSGSKSAVLSVLIVAMLYAHYFIAPIRASSALLFAVLAVTLFLVQLVVAGVYGDLISAGTYFVDYFFYGAEFLSRSDEIGHRYGAGWLSSLWFYVPRALYPGKPYEYGLTLIHQKLFPGMAEDGTTPGMMVWALSYLDFGAFGVAMEGFVLGSFQRAVFLNFRRRRGIAMFTVLLSACYVPIFPYATPVLYLTIASLLGVGLNRFAVRRRREPGAAPPQRRRAPPATSPAP